LGPGGTILLRGSVVVVAIGVVDAVVEVVVEESELPLLERIKLKVRATKATTSSTTPSRATPAGRQRPWFRGAEGRSFGMGLMVPEYR
jgi:hypothetical protein